MVCYLTSSPCVEGAPELNPANGFVESLWQDLPSELRAVFVCSDPDGHDFTDGFAGDMQAAFETAGFRFADFQVLDGRNPGDAAALLAGADLVILAGGHVPTQNRFFAQIGLRALLQGFGGVVMGISAGTMNSADTVYAQPELDGEATDPAYQRFLPGLGLTNVNVLPHYQDVWDTELDGMRLFEDVTYPDSMGRAFLVLVDGSYLYLRDGAQALRGEAYLLSNAEMQQISAEGDEICPFEL